MSTNLTREIAVNRDELIKINNYQVILDISEASTSASTFPVISRIKLEQLKTGKYALDFIGEKVSQVVIDNNPVAYSYTEGLIVLPELPAGEHTIEVQAFGFYSRSGEGLHRFVDPEDQQTYLYTQFEPADAQRVYPCFDQPSLKARFNIEIIAPTIWTTLSNTSVKETRSAGFNSSGMELKHVVFAETLPISTYLTAFIAGPYAEFKDTAVNLDGSDIELGFYCRQPLVKYFEIDDIKEVTKQGLALLPKTFGGPYPWGKYDSVFVPEYNLGAMENPGCVTFSEDSFIQRGNGTRAQRAARANTILHEMAHMWFGDLVTPKWWNDLWLKESFAEFMGAWSSVNGTQYQEAWKNFSGARLAWALKNDQYPTTHPILADIPDLAAADQAFDGITYAKGAAVLRQLVAWLGEDKFFAAAREFFAKYKFGNASFEDFLEILGKDDSAAITRWTDEWMATTGVSTVVAERTANGLKLTQIPSIDALTGKEVYRSHRILVSSFALADDVLQKHQTISIELRESLVIPWDELGGEHLSAYLPNDESWSYLKVALDSETQQAFTSYRVADSFSQSIISNILWQEVRDARVDVCAYLRFVELLAPEASAALLQTLLLNLHWALRFYTHPQLRTDIVTKAVKIATNFFNTATVGTDAYQIWGTALSRFAALSSDTGNIIAAAINETRDQDLRWKFLATGAAVGIITQTAIDEELKENNTAKDYQAAVFAKSSLA
ncbi:MAG: aminopeptidase N, partial [Arcanobacterium sp.]|nr:aminopeptidase N [Arcanobacterium sp.]